MASTWVIVKITILVGVVMLLGIYIYDPFIEANCLCQERGFFSKCIPGTEKHDLTCQIAMKKVQAISTDIANSWSDVSKDIAKLHNLDTNIPYIPTDNRMLTSAINDQTVKNVVIHGSTKSGASIELLPPFHGTQQFRDLDLLKYFNQMHQDIEGSANLVKNKVTDEIKRVERDINSIKTTIDKALMLAKPEAQAKKLVQDTAAKAAQDLVTKIAGEKAGKVAGKETSKYVGKALDGATGAVDNIGKDVGSTTKNVVDDVGSAVTSIFGPPPPPPPPEKKKKGCLIQ